MNMDIEPKKNKKMSIYDCFELFTQKEEIENIFCENCQKKETFTKILKIERIPEYLVITLKRFQYDEKKYYICIRDWISGAAGLR